MGRIEDVCNVLGQACTTAVNTAGITIPGQAYVGAPLGSSLTKILTQAQYAITIMPMQAGRRIAPRMIQHVNSNVPDATLVSSLTQTGFAFSGTCADNYNVNVIVTCQNIGVRAISYITSADDTPTTVAASIATAINSFGSGISATVTGPSIATTGIYKIVCNIGNKGTISQESSRFEQRIKVRVWTPTAYKKTNNPTADVNNGLRASVCDAIINAVGTELNMWYDMGDGTSVRFRLASLPFYIDESESDYNLYEAQIVYLAEYSLITTSTATQVGVVELDVSLPTTNLVIIGG